MGLVTELGAWRVLTLLLLIILIGLSFYILFDALERCKEVTTRLNQEISNMHILAEDSENEEEWLLIQPITHNKVYLQTLSNLAFSFCGQNHFLIQA